MARMTFRNVKLRLPPRDSPDFTVQALEKRLVEDQTPFGPWQKR